MPAARTLKNDTRGAVLLFGLFGAVLLVGVLYYVAGVGDAIVHHETMQDAADATAYSAAVYHARGMNIIAMINLTMAAVLAVLVILKIAQVLLTVVGIAACVCAAASLGIAAPCDAICVGVGEAWPELNDAILLVGTAVECALQGLRVASTGVAVLMPEIAAGRSAAFAMTEYGGVVDSGLAVSWSMLPGIVVDSVAKPLENKALTAVRNRVAGKGGATGGGETPNPDQGAGAQPAGNAETPGAQTAETTVEKDATTTLEKDSTKLTSVGSKIKNVAVLVCSAISQVSNSAVAKDLTTTRVGLPVTDENFSVLCNAAGQMSGGVLLDNGFFLPGLASVLPAAISRFIGNADKVLGDLVATVSWYFCQSVPMPPVPDDSQLQSATNPTSACSAGAATVAGHNSTAASAASSSNPAPQATPVPGSHEQPPAANQHVTPQTGAQCRQTAKQRADQVTKDAEKAKEESEKAIAQMQSEAPKKVYDAAEQGSDYYAVWSAVHGDWNSRAQRGVSIASWGHASANGADAEANFSFAEAEFYFDEHGHGGFSFSMTPGNSTPQDTPEKFPDDAMWNMRWRARLRRVWPPSPRFGALILAKFKGGLDQVAEKLLGKNSASLPVQKAIDYLAGKASLDTPFGSIPTNPNAVLKPGDEKVNEAVGLGWRATGAKALVH